MTRPRELTIGHVLKKCLDQGVLSPESPLGVFLDFYHLDRRIGALAEAFPGPGLNTVAVKACPLVRLLQRMASRGLGAECASSGELAIAQRAGFAPDRIVYDSPVKRRNEIRRVLRTGMTLNIDNAMEMDRIERMLSGETFPVRLGVRVNPETGSGSIPRTSTATRQSKFGIPASHIPDVLSAHPLTARKLTGLHVHTGSQGFPISHLVRSVEITAALAETLNSESGLHIEWLDIGGGLPVQYSRTDENVAFSDYAQALKTIPSLRNYRLITEFGRAIFAPVGWIAARVEYVKVRAGRRIVLNHAGADVFLRAAYMDWYHEIIVFDGSGELKSGGESAQDIAGPLCFSGDFTARSRMLPEIAPGDWLVYLDSGAYTFGMWSMYNSRAFPPVYGYDLSEELTMLHPGISGQSIADFWDFNP